MNLIGYSDFVRLCHVDDQEEWCSWLSVRGVGVYVKEQEPSGLFSEERAILSEHPTGNLCDPALRFPCSLAEFKDFLELQGVYGCVDPFDLVEFTQRSGDGMDNQYSAPTGTPENAAQPVPVVTNATLPAGVPAHEIIEKFKLAPAWADKLRHIGRYRFLKASGALMQQGCRKSATSNGMPNLFNPVKFAEMLMAREGKTAQQMKRVIEARFKPWQDAWDTAQSVDAPGEWEE